MKRIIWILWIVLLIYVIGCSTSPPKAGFSSDKTKTQPPTPVIKPIIKASEEGIARESLLQGNWTKAYEEYERLLKQNIKSPIAEYYFYQLLQVQDYSAGTISAKGGPSGKNNLSELINYLCDPQGHPVGDPQGHPVGESPDANENLKAIA
ncbi:MAG: hypothetical protein V1709_03745, partial [Planctomycetota bacterium]